jgi:hypothetical protein
MGRTIKRDIPPETADAQLERYRRDPVAFVRELLGIEPQAWQARVIADLYDRLDRGERVYVDHLPARRMCRTALEALFKKANENGTRPPSE